MVPGPEQKEAVGPRLWRVDRGHVPLHVFKRYRSSNREPDCQQPDADRDIRAADSGSSNRDRHANAATDAHTHADPDASANQGTNTAASTNGGTESLSKCARRESLVLQLRVWIADLQSASELL